MLRCEEYGVHDVQYYFEFYKEAYGAMQWKSQIAELEVLALIAKE